MWPDFSGMYEFLKLELKARRADRKLVEVARKTGSVSPLSHGKLQPLYDLNESIAEEK